MSEAGGAQAGSVMVKQFVEHLGRLGPEMRGFRDLADLQPGQVLRILVHDRIRTQIRGETARLSFEIAAMLSRQARERSLPLRP